MGIADDEADGELTFVVPVAIGLDGMDAVPLEVLAAPGLSFPETKCVEFVCAC